MTTVTMDQAMDCLVENILSNQPTMLWGAPGIGKSQLWAQVAKRLGYNLIDFRATLKDPVDLMGLPLVDAKAGTTRWLPPVDLPNEQRHGKKGIFFCDELPQASMAIKTALFGLILERRLGEYRMPEGWVPVAAGNRMEDRSGATALPDALKNRFAHYTVLPDVDAWVKWAAANGVDPMVIAFVRFRPMFLHAMPQRNENTFPTPRAWEAVSKVCKGDKEALRQKRVASLVGDGIAAEFEGFYQTFKELPSIDEILKDPKGVRIPDDGKMGQFYALASALSYRAARATFDAAIQYTDRMPTPEFNIMMVTDAVRRDPALKKTNAFANWAVKHSEVLL